MARERGNSSRATEIISVAREGEEGEKKFPPYVRMHARGREGETRERNEKRGREIFSPSRLSSRREILSRERERDILSPLLFLYSHFLYFYKVIFLGFQFLKFSKDTKKSRKNVNSKIIKIYIILMNQCH